MGALTLAERAVLAEDPAQASETRDLCQKCGLWATCLTPFMLISVPSGWHSSRRILVVAEAPGAHEDQESEKPLTGPAGQLFDACLLEAGLDLADVARANACRCRPPRNATPTLTQLRACRPFLLDVLIRLKPQIVIALGATAIRALTNGSRKIKVAQARGRSLEIPGLVEPPPLVYATYHPSSVLRGRTDYRAHLVADLARAARPLRPQPINELPTSLTCGVDTEYAPDGTLLTLGIADTRQATATEGTGMRVLATALFKKVDVLCGHNLPGDIDYLVKLGAAKPHWLRGERTRDTLLLARMVNENRGRGRYGLETLGFELADLMFWKAPTEKAVKAGQVETLSPERRMERCRLDAHAPVVLADLLIEKIRDQYGPAGMRLAEFAHRLDMTLRRVYLAGAVVDLPTFTTRGQELRADVDRLTALLQVYARREGMTEFSGTNDHHVRALLYDKLGYTTDRTTSTGLLAVDKHTLKRLAEDKNPVVADLLEYRRARKLLGVWYGTPDRTSKRTPLVDLIEPLKGVLGDTAGLLRFRLRTLATRTGRRASGKDEDTPDAVGHNAQNWPKDVRRMIRSRWDGGLIGAFDYRKLEPRIIAWVSGDEWLMDLFTVGEGYIGIARELFGKRVEEGTRDYTVMKSTVLAAHYNATADTLAETLYYQAGVRFARRWSTHVARCQDLLDKYLGKARGVRAYMAKCEEELLATGQVVCPSGAIRHLPCPNGRKTPGYKHLLNEAINAPIQRTAAEVTGSAVVDVEVALCKEYHVPVEVLHKMLVLEGPMFARMPLIINEVHDEVTVDLPPGRIKRDTELIVETMRAVPTLHRLITDGKSLPLDVDPKVASRWHGEDA